MKIKDDGDETTTDENGVDVATTVDHMLAP